MRKRCTDCFYQGLKKLPGRDEEQLYCSRYNHWLDPDNMQIDIGFMAGALCDFRPKIKRIEVSTGEQ